MSGSVTLPGSLAEPGHVVTHPGWRRTATVLASVVGAVIAAVLVLLLVHPSTLASGNPIAGGGDVLAAPSRSHLFGTDQLGRDLFARIIWGARPVLLASVLGVCAATILGMTLGIIGGVAPRLISAVVMRVVDVLLALPVLLIALMIIAIAGSGVSSIVIAVAVAFTPGYARVVAVSVRRLRRAEYVQAAQVFGESGPRTALRHLVPNLATEVIVLVTSGIGWAVLTSTTLSFLGLGVRLPSPDWGTDLAAGATYISSAWWLTTFPGLAITVTIVFANFLGDIVIGELDPRGRRQLRGAVRAVVGSGFGPGNRWSPALVVMGRHKGGKTS